MRTNVFSNLALALILMGLYMTPVCLTAQNAERSNEVNEGYLFMDAKWPQEDKEWISSTLDSLKTAYVQKNIDFIVASMRQEVNGKRIYSDYIRSLKQAFLSCEDINVRYDSLEVVKGYGPKEGLYAGSFKVETSSDDYSDHCWLTYVFDFRNKEDRKIKFCFFGIEYDRMFDPFFIIEKFLTVSAENR
ncbi:MAG: hypothetical protein E7118_05105 [Bacteroidales bacterium]|nr:hypothetical protein [Bacteroidales bacterium]